MISDGPFAGLRKDYGVILADPPWTFATRSPKGLTNRPQHYRRMSLDEIKALPVRELAAPDCWVFLWTTWLHIRQAFEVADAWGLTYSSSGFVWAKRRRSGLAGWHVGQGFTTRKSTEACLLFRYGQPKRHDGGVRELIVSPRREHSRKPDEQYERIDAFAGPCRKVELFARHPRPMWDRWGDAR